MDDMYEIDLVLDYLDGFLPNDLHEEVRQKIKDSEDFKDFVLGVQDDYIAANRDREVMVEKLNTELEIIRKNILGNIKNKSAFSASYLTKRFKIPPSWEKFIPSPGTPKYAFRGGDFDIQSPVYEQNVQDELLIVFNQPIDNKTNIRIVDNTNDEMYGQNIDADTNQHHVDTSNLQPGVYCLCLDDENNKDFVIFYIQKELKPDIN